MLRFPSKIWIALLLPIVLAGAGRSQAQSDASTSGFETFVLPSPSPPAASSTSGATSSSTQQSRERPPNPAIVEDSLGAQIGLTLFPGNTSLGILLAGMVQGQSIQSQMSPLEWRQGVYAGSGFIQVSHDGEGVRLGNSTEDPLGNVQSLRLFGLGNSTTGSIGLGLYHGISDQNPFSGTPAIDDDWHMGQGVDTDFLAAMDSSWRFSQNVQRKAWQVSWFSGRDHHEHRMESGLFASAQPDRSSTLYTDLTTWNGIQPGFNWALGGTRHVGKLFIGIDNTLMREPANIATETGFGVILPMQRGSFGIRLQRGQIDPQDEFGIGTQRSSLLYASYNKLFTPALSMSFSAGASAQSGAPTQKFVAMEAQRALNSRWSLYADITQRLDKSQRQLQFAVGCRISNEWQVRVLCAPSEIASPTGQEPQALGIQITRSLNVQRTRSGTIVGQLFLNGRAYEKSVDILLDNGYAARTAHGKFKITDVVPGPHTVAIAPACLPADLCPDSFGIDVDVVAGKTSSVQFTIRPVGQIHGNVQVIPDALGQTDPTAAVGVTVSAGGNLATTTDQNGDFVIGDVPAGTYTVTLNTGTIPPDFGVVGPASATVVVDPNQPAPVVQFQIQKNRTNIIFAQAPSAPSEPSATRPVAARGNRAPSSSAPAMRANPAAKPPRRPAELPLRPAAYQKAEAAPAHIAPRAPVAKSAATGLVQPAPRAGSFCVCQGKCCCGCQAWARSHLTLGHRRHRTRHGLRLRHARRHASYHSHRRRSHAKSRHRIAYRHSGHRSARRRAPFVCPCPHPTPWPGHLWGRGFPHPGNFRTVVVGIFRR